jgi:hypothetical protein
LATVLTFTQLGEIGIGTAIEIKLDEADEEWMNKYTPVYQYYKNLVNRKKSKVNP